MKFPRQLITLAVFMLLTAASHLAVAADIRLATTTSTANSGLLKAILAQFEAEYGDKVRVIAVGTGKALKLGENGDVDVVLVHSRSDEDKFVAAGHGVNRRNVMYNDFILVGPAGDLAGIRGMKDVIAAFRKIAAIQAKFISRGDESGTDKMEQSYWRAAGINPKGEAWHVSAGLGMGAVLTMAGEMQGYTLSDRATYGAYMGKTGLEVLVSGNPKMFNPYGVIAVNPKKFPDANYQGAMAFINWLTSAKGQQAVAAFRVNGEQLFFPDTH